MNRNEIEAQLRLLDSLAGQLPADAYQARKAELEAQLQDFANSADGSGQPQTQTTAFNNRSVTIGGEVKDSIIVTANGVIVQRVPADTADIALLQEAYYRCLAHECSRLPLGDIDPKFDKPGMDEGVRLAKVYTDLHVVNPVRHEDDDERDWGLRLARGEGQERQSVLEAISGDERCVVLIGDPGSGKTTLVNYLTFCLAEPTATVSADLPESIRGLLPVRLILRNLVAYLPENAEKGSVELIWQALRDDLHEHIGQIAGDRLFQRWQTQLLGQPVLILLDGLDEVPAMGKRRACLVRSLRDWVVGLHRQSRVIVTARPYAYADPSWQLPAFTVFALAPFNREQMNTFIASWCEAVRPITGWTRATCDEHVASLMHALAQRHDLADLASRPLLLTLMATLHSTWGKLPDDRADLLEESVKLLLWRWQQHRTVKDEQGKPLEEFGIADDLGISESTLRETLEQLAHEAHNAQGQQKKRSNDAADIHFDRLMALLAEIAPLHLNPKVLAAYLQNRAGLLISRQGNTYAFPHRLLQEYLTACHLGHIEEDLADTLITLLHKDETWWREVYLLCVGRMRTRRRLAVDLIDALVPDDVAAVRRPNKRHWRAAILAGEALLELRLGQLPKLTGFEKTVRKRVRDWLSMLLEKAALAPRERLRAGDVLGRLGDPRPGVSIKPLTDKTEIPDLDWAWVPTGQFTMGEDDEAHTLKLAGFYISRYPVTNAQYRLFIDAGGYSDPQWWTAQGWAWRGGVDSDLSGLEDKKYREILAVWLKQRSKDKRQRPWFWDDPRWSMPNRPVAGVCWYEAQAYSRWLDARLRATDKALFPRFAKGYRIQLPSEAQWEKAAGGRQGYAWPWGNAWQEGCANTQETGLGETSPVGLFPQGISLYGCHDMAGNVWEWTRSRWGRRFEQPDFHYPYAADDGREQLDNDDLRVVRGGSWVSNQRLACCAARRRLHPGLAYDLLGFRVVLSLAEC